jgi:hypothetical protein
LNKTVLAFDFDGVIKDFFSHFLVFANKELGMAVKYDEVVSHNLAECFGTSEKVMSELHQRYQEIYDNDDVLEWVEGAREHLDLLGERYAPAVITSRKTDLEDRTIGFFGRQLPHIPLYFANGRNNPYGKGNGRPFKPQMAERIGAIALADDNEQEFLHWDSNIVKPICFAQPWNACIAESHPHILRATWPELTEYLMSLP